MQVLNRLGKLPLHRALTLIKAISKKKADTIASEKSNFIDGAKENGISEKEAEELFELILKFAGYGFNKAHSTRYAIVAYQTAYFKKHYPREFLAATLTFECGDTDKVVQYMAEAERMKIRIAPPDINTCTAYFTVDGDRVRFGLAAVKGVGAKAVESIIETRKEVGRFENLYHFCEYVDLRAVNRSTIEALIKCGAFDALGAHRAAMLAAVDQAIELGQKAAADRKSGQMNFFEMMEGGKIQKASPQFPPVEAFSESQLLAIEKETLGFYISSHPLVHYGRELDSLSSPRGVGLARLADLGEGTPVTIGAMITSVRHTFTKKNNEKMAMLTVEDLTGKCDAVVFPRSYEQFAAMIHTDAMVFLVGTVDLRRERPNLIIDEVIPIDQAVEQLTGKVIVRLAGDLLSAEKLQPLRNLLGKHRGNCPVLLELSPIKRPDIRTTIQPDRKWFVSPRRKLLDELAEFLQGRDENLRLLPKPSNGNGNGRNNKRPFGKKPLPVRSKYGETGEVSAAVTRFD